MKESKNAPVHDWHPKYKDVIAYPDGKVMVFSFTKAFMYRNFSDVEIERGSFTTKDRERIYLFEAMKPRSEFLIKKDNYVHMLDKICKYINYFMKFYDMYDELIVAYLRIKWLLDTTMRFGKDDMQALIDLTYELLFTPTMKDAICRIVQDNYLDDIENKGGKKNYGKTYMESLEFTNEHMRILLCISFGMKLIAPIMLHWCGLRRIKVDSIEVCYRFYRPLLELFQGNTDIYTKLFVYVRTKIKESKSHNQTIYRQREIFGTDEFDVMREFVDKVLIADNIVKYSFTETWNSKLKKYKESITAFNKTVIRYQIIYFLKKKYAATLTEVSNVKNSDGLSGNDKLEANIETKDEGILILAELNIEYGIRRIKKMFGVEISQEEIDYYQANMSAQPLQVMIVYSYFAKFIESFRDLNLTDGQQYIMFALILKKKLLIDFGVTDMTKVCRTAALPYILTGNIEDSVNNRIIRNSKFINGTHGTDAYNTLVTKKYSFLQELKPEYLDSLLSSFINTRFVYVTYEEPELSGSLIEYNENKLSAELLYLLKTM